MVENPRIAVGIRPIAGLWGGEGKERRGENVNEGREWEGKGMGREEPPGPKTKSLTAAL